MLLDTVHDVQSAYRKLVHASAFPGSVVDVGPEAQRIDLESPLARPLLLLAIMLVDAEVAFAIVSDRRSEYTALVAQLTYSRDVTVEDAGYVFVPCDSAPSHAATVAAAIASARRGTLVSPHLGATVIVEVASVSEGADSATTLALTGPGIRDERVITIPDADHWVRARAHANREYPLGVDLILVTAAGRLVAIPRTIRIESRGEQWAT